MWLYDNIWKTTIDQGDDYTNDCLLDYLYFKENYKLIAIDLSKEHALDFDPKAMQQIIFTGTQDWPNNATMYFIIQGAKETILYFHKEPWEYCNFILLWYNSTIKRLNIIV